MSLYDGDLARARTETAELAKAFLAKNQEAERETDAARKSVLRDESINLAAKLTEARVKVDELAAKKDVHDKAEEDARWALEPSNDKRVPQPAPAGAEPRGLLARRVRTEEQAYQERSVALAFAMGGYERARREAGVVGMSGERFNTMIMGDSAAGGSHVPVEWLQPAEFRPDPVVLRDEVNRRETTADQVVVPKLLELETDNYRDEGHEFGTADADRQDAATPGRSIGLGTWHPKPVVMTLELIEATDIEPEIAQRFRWALGLDTDKSIIKGTGVKQPMGLYNEAKVTGASIGNGAGVNEINTGDADLLTVAGIVNLIYQHPEQWSMGTKICMRRPTFANVLTLEDGAGGFPFAIGHAVAPDTILGVPCIYSQHVDKVAANKHPMIHGWWPAYTLLENPNALRFKRLVEKYDPNIGLSVSGRQGGAAIQLEAFTLLKVAA